MNAVDVHRDPLYWAGVALGPAAWGVSTQALYAITPLACTNQSVATPIVAAALVAVALAGTVISARAVRRSAALEWADARGGRARSFMAWLGVGTGVLFALVIANQLAAALMIGPCLR